MMRKKKNQITNHQMPLLPRKEVAIMIQMKIIHPKMKMKNQVHTVIPVIEMADSDEKTC